jgi:hypothetical protein
MAKSPIPAGKVRTTRLVPVDIPANAPYLPPVVTRQEAWAVKALIEGKASAAEQGIVTRFIFGRLSEIGSLPIYPNDRDNNIALGRRYPGHHLLRIGQMTPEQIALLPDLGGTGGEDDEMPTL